MTAGSSPTWLIVTDANRADPLDGLSVTSEALAHMLTQKTLALFTQVRHFGVDYYVFPQRHLIPRRHPDGRTGKMLRLDTLGNVEGRS